MASKAGTHMGLARFSLCSSLQPSALPSAALAGKGHATWVGTLPGGSQEVPKGDAILSGCQTRHVIPVHREEMGPWQADGGPPQWRAVGETSSERRRREMLFEGTSFPR